MKSTPFLEMVKQAGGRLIDFGGWQMPVQYSGVLEEHHAVRKAVGLFDVSHMGEVEARGPQAQAYTQNLVSNDVSGLVLGQAQYTVMCLPDGGIVDDLIVYKVAEDHFLFCINASNTDKDVAWMKGCATGFDVVVEDRSAAYAQLAIQGPKAEATLSELTSSDLSTIGFYHFRQLELAGVPILAARTGYTGEDGFEVFLPPEAAEGMWKAIMGAGEKYGIRPVGLGARDTLRLEMKFALYGNDIDETTNPLEAGLGWVVKLSKPSFNGRDALVAARDKGLGRKLVGFELLERGVPRHGYRAMSEAGEAVGVVTSGAMSPSLNKPIGMVYLPTALSAVGSRFMVEIRQKLVPAVVVKTPFYKPTPRG